MPIINAKATATAVPVTIADTLSRDFIYFILLLL